MIWHVIFHLVWSHLAIPQLCKGWPNLRQAPPQHLIGLRLPGSHLPDVSQWGAASGWDGGWRTWDFFGSYEAWWKLRVMKVGDVFMDHDEILMKSNEYIRDLLEPSSHGETHVQFGWHFLDAQLRAIAPMCDADIVLDAIELHSWIVGWTVVGYKW